MGTATKPAGRKAITISLPEGTLKKARAKATAERRSLSAQVAVWIDQAMAKEERK
jgi:hypothetical protein